MKKILTVCFFSLVFVLCAFPVRADSIDRFFPIQSIDTMKYSRDSAQNKSVTEQIPLLVSQAATLGPTHIAIGTPYDEEFYPVIKKWADEIHKRGLRVWFRGNFSGWEGWFNYPKFTDYNQHHILQSQFIRKHPELFVAGDIFTPAPEPENGVIGDPRSSDENKQKFLDFLPRSYRTCIDSFKAINKPEISCGYFSTNGDIAKYIFTPQLIASIGNRIVIDHYVKTPQQLAADIVALSDRFKVPIVLGEFGAPIPDIQGEMDEQQQAAYVQQVMRELVKIKDKVGGINYWTGFGGSTAIFNDDFQMKKAGIIITDYYQPELLEGIVSDTFEFAVPNATVSTPNFLYQTKTQTNGTFKLLISRDVQDIMVSKNGFISYKKTIIHNTPFLAKLEYSQKNLGYYLKYILQIIRKI